MPLILSLPDSNKKEYFMYVLIGLLNWGYLFVGVQYVFNETSNTFFEQILIWIQTTTHFLSPTRQIQRQEGR